MQTADKLKAIRTRLGLSQDAFAKAIDLKGASSYQRYEDPDYYVRRAYIRPEMAEKIWQKFGPSLGMDQADVMALAGMVTAHQPKGDGRATSSQPSGRSQPQSESAQIISGAQGQLSGPRDVKILGHARAGTSGVFVDNGNIQGYAVRPDVLSGSKDGYAIYCHDKSMEPAIHSGWLCYVDPARPLQPGDDVVIQLIDGQAFIKRYVRRTQRTLFCQQFNPAEPVEYPADQVKSVHLIVNANRVRT